jgi:hypothetical protein
MKFNKLLLIISIMAVALFTTECNTANIYIPSQALTQPPASELPNYFIGHFTILPSPLPGKISECTFTFQVGSPPKEIFSGVSSDTLADAKAWIGVIHTGVNGPYSDARKYTDVPVEDIVVSGDTSWAGNAQENPTIQLKCSIRLPSDGIWIFTGYFTGSNWRTPLSYSQNIAVVDGVSVPFASLNSSPLAYIRYFEYGIYPYPSPDSQHPITLELDVPHPPQKGEEVKLLFRAFSPFYDVENFNFRLKFHKFPAAYEIDEVPVEDIVVDGKGQWDFTLLKNEVREFSTTIKFPETGIWQISVSGDCLVPEIGRVGYSDMIPLTITDTVAYYGHRIFPPTTPTVEYSSGCNGQITIISKTATSQH